MTENTHRIADTLEKYFGSRLIAEGDRVLFTPPKKALVATLFGNPHLYENASLMMQMAEREYIFWGMMKQ